MTTFVKLSVSRNSFLGFIEKLIRRLELTEEEVIFTSFFSAEKRDLERAPGFIFNDKSRPDVLVRILEWAERFLERDGTTQQVIVVLMSGSLAEIKSRIDDPDGLDGDQDIKELTRGIKDPERTYVISPIRMAPSTRTKQ